MMELESDFSALFAPEPAPTGLVAAVPCWQVLLVDDDVDIHAALRLSLQDMLVEGVPLQLLDAYSAAEARELLARNTEIALILLDVVMETSDAGLALVQHIRQEKRNRTVRIVLLTGQPGYSPQREIVMNYEIDDYRLKSDLSADKLFTCVYAELRTYQALRMLEKKRLVEQLGHHSTMSRRNTYLDSTTVVKKPSIAMINAASNSTSDLRHMPTRSNCATVVTLRVSSARMRSGDPGPRSNRHRLSSIASPTACIAATSASAITGTAPAAALRSAA